MVLTNLIRFFTEDIWYTHADDLPLVQSLVLKFVKILLLSGYGFVRDLCTLRASALTLYTMLSIVPMIAMIFGLTKGFGYEQILKENLLQQIPEQETMMLQLIDFAENLLATTKGGLVAGIGIVVLLWTVIKVIATIEASFNQVWKVKKGRMVGKRVGDYLSLMLLAPMLLIASSSLTVFIKTHVTELIGAMGVPQFGTNFVLYLFSYSPMAIMWVLFTFTFIFMPNTKVKFMSGLLAGVITGTVYQIVQWVYISLQIGVSSYNAIYGSFAALPLFIVWLQIAWLIVLFGSEISFYHQNFESYRHHDKYSNISFALKKVLTLQIVQLIVKQFAEARKALTAQSISEQTDIPVSVVIQMLQFARESGLVVEIKASDNGETEFQPAMDISLITVYSVLTALERKGISQMPDVKGLAPFVNTLDDMNQTLKVSAENRLLKDF